MKMIKAIDNMYGSTDDNSEKMKVKVRGCHSGEALWSTSVWLEFHAMLWCITESEFVVKTDWLRAAFQIISAQQLPKINTEKASSIVDPQVWVEIHGVAIDNTRDKTQRIDNNGNATIHYKAVTV